MAKTSVYSGAKVLITGGAGFIGSNLAIKLAEEKAEVTIVDFLHPDYGGNLFNLNPVEDKIVFKKQDLNDFKKTVEAVKKQDFIFHLASQQNHVLWRDEPYSDLQNNVRATITLLEALKKTKSAARLVYGGTRGEYGAQTSPVGENAVPKPLGFYELSKLFAGEACQLYSSTLGFEFVWARLTNVYGPRARVKSNASNIVNWFVRLALEEKELPLYYGGRINRDLLYVEDCVDALLALGGVSDEGIFNIGSGKPVLLLDVAKKIVEEAGTGSVTFVEADERRRKQEVGDVFLDVGKLKRNTSFAPKTTLEAGIRLTVDYYKKYLRNYV